MTFPRETLKIVRPILVNATNIVSVGCREGAAGPDGGEESVDYGTSTLMGGGIDSQEGAGEGSF